MRNMLVWIVSCILLTACQTTPWSLAKPVPALTPEPTPAITPARPVLPIEAQNVGELVDLDAFTGTQAHPVAALAFTADGQELLAVQAPSGELSRWRVADGVLLDTLQVGPVGVVAAAFDDGATVVATGAGQIAPAIQAGYAVEFNGLRVWDTQTGKLLLETTLPTESFGQPVTDVALSPDGQWAGEVGSGVSVWDVDTGKPMELNAVFTQPKQNGDPTEITVFTFDPSGKWHAYATDGGRVDINEWELTASGSWVVHTGVEETPLALAIDPSRSYLAAVTTESLVWWDLQSFFGRILLKESLPPGPAAGLTFSPDGSLLAVGTAGSWQLWSVAEKKLLFALDEGSFAVAFSPDGRLFAWGDTAGVVHLWGVPE